MTAALKLPQNLATTHTIKAAPLPDRYARGWHCLGLAAPYRDSKPHSLDVFGTRLAVFSGEDGNIRILDAWCPHMGADLGIGQVVGNALACRFHGWQFGGDGKCAHIPYARHIPPKARVRSWPVLEENGLLFVWNDPEGGAPPESERIPRLEAAFSPDWSDWSMSEWTIHTNCRELIDNLSDMAHFGPVHGSENVVYFANVFEGHKATQVMVGLNQRLGGQANYLRTVATYYGPATLITTMRGESDGLPIDSILLVTHVPIDPNSFQLRFGVKVRRIPSLTDEQNRQLAAAYTDLTVKAFSEDVAIWHNKVRVDNPLLCEGDGPIYALREWYNQFYLDRGAVPEKLARRQVVEMDRGLGESPALEHAFG